MIGSAHLSASDIARLASPDGSGDTSGDSAHPHLAECLVCRRALAAERRVRDALSALPAPRMAAGHKRALAAEILAHAQADLPARRIRVRRAGSRPGLSFAIAGVLVAAAMAVVVPSLQTAPPSTPNIASAPMPDDTSIHAERIAADDGAPALAPPKISTHGAATLSHRVGDERDVLVLVDGTIDVDTRSARHVDVRVGDSTVRIDDASVRIRAHKHAIVSVQVVVGAARVTSPEQHVVLERDSIWLPDASHADQSLSSFRDAWIELRAGHNREAMELFDRVTDPVVLEEARYWSAIAAERTGDAALGEARMREFHRRFPSSELGR